MVLGAQFRCPTEGHLQLLIELQSRPGETFQSMHWAACSNNVLCKPVLYTSQRPMGQVKRVAQRYTPGNCQDTDQFCCSLTIPRRKSDQCLQQIVFQCSSSTTCDPK
jgi:hypothetical protein